MSAGVGLCLLAGAIVLGSTRTGGDPIVSAISRQINPGGSSAADGVIDEPADVDDTRLPALANLDPALLAAVRRAAHAAAAHGITVRVTSGWRSRQYQQRLLDQAIHKYGSYHEARRWVRTPNDSQHVVGAAIDIGPTDAADWFSRHGSDYGLCQVYANEMWHYELLTTPHGECPALRPDNAS